MDCKVCNKPCTEDICEKCIQKLHIEASRGREDKFISERRVITFNKNDYLFEALYEITGQEYPILIPIQEPILRRRL